MHSFTIKCMWGKVKMSFYFFCVSSYQCDFQVHPDWYNSATIIFRAELLSLSVKNNVNRFRAQPYPLYSDIWTTIEISRSKKPRYKMAGASLDSGVSHKVQTALAPLVCKSIFLKHQVWYSTGWWFDQSHAVLIVYVRHHLMGEHWYFSHYLRL